jgi:hypothetical protein
MLSCGDYYCPCYIHVYADASYVCKMFLFLVQSSRFLSYLLLYSEKEIKPQRYLEKYVKSVKVIVYILLFINRFKCFIF